MMFAPGMDHAARTEFARDVRAGAHADVHVNVCFHVASVEVTDSSEAPGGKEIVGGDLTAIVDWTPQENVTGLHVV
jgi:hypothetical protein